MFDEKTKQNLKNYVYMLLDPRGNMPFYVGKGKDNRVFDHINCALIDNEKRDLKYEIIKEIQNKGHNVEHVILRHGLKESEAFHIEASIIDLLNFLNLNLANKVTGHHSIDKGVMTTDEIKRLYNAPRLNRINPDCIIININKKYIRGKSSQAIYEATKETWSIDKKNLPRLKYVLSEYKGLIVEVFEVDNWYDKERGYTPQAKKYGETKIGYGFNGHVAPEEIRKMYMNKSIAHAKGRGASNSIRYNLN